MKRSGYYISTLSIVVGMLLSGNISALRAQHDHGATEGKGGGCCASKVNRTEKAEQVQAVQLGRKAEITLGSDVQVGSLTLKAGRYVLQHRGVRSVHFLHFTELEKANPYHRITQGAKAHPGEVRCRLEPLPAKASRTAVYLSSEDGISRVTKVEIAGEYVAHLL